MIISPPHFLRPNQFLTGSLSAVFCPPYLQWFFHRGGLFFASDHGGKTEIGEERVANGLVHFPADEIAYFLREKTERWRETKSCRGWHRWQHATEIANQGASKVFQVPFVYAMRPQFKRKTYLIIIITHWSRWSTTSLDSCMLFIRTHFLKYENEIANKRKTTIIEKANNMSWRVNASNWEYRLSSAFTRSEHLSSCDNLSCTRILVGQSFFVLTFGFSVSAFVAGDISATVDDVVSVWWSAAVQSGLTSSWNHSSLM